MTNVQTTFFHPFQKSLNSGFTLIELLIVFSVIGIISTVSIASFVNYSRGATLKQAELDVAATLRDAKARTQSQIKPTTCSGTLQGYRVDICGITGSTCSTPNTYQLSMVCSGGTNVVSSKSLPGNVSFQSTSTTSASFTFQTITNGVSGAGAVIVQGYEAKKAITVSQTGAISTE